MQPQAVRDCSACSLAQSKLSQGTGVAEPLQKYNNSTSLPAFQSRASKDEVQTDPVVSLMRFWPVLLSVFFQLRALFVNLLSLWNRWTEALYTVLSPPPSLFLTAPSGDRSWQPNISVPSQWSHSLYSFTPWNSWNWLRASLQVTRAGFEYSPWGPVVDV